MYLRSKKKTRTFRFSCIQVPDEDTFSSHARACLLADNTDGETTFKCSLPRSPPRAADMNQHRNFVRATS